MADTALFLIQYGELALKGKNRSQFMRRLRSNIRAQLGDEEAVFSERSGRIFLEVDRRRKDETSSVLSRVFGIHGFTETQRLRKSMDPIRSACLNLIPGLLSQGNRFRIEARRTDKGFPLTSYQMACDIGDAVRNTYSGLSVNLDDPDWTVHIEIRDAAYIYSSVDRGPGGLPTGSAGRGLLLLSGGIDSPVAGYRMAKRGVTIDAVYFHTPPYVSERTREKVETLTKILSRHVPEVGLWTVPYSDIQVKLKTQGEPRSITLLSRAAMMEISCLLAKMHGKGCIITGESLGQVASQTMESLDFTGSRATVAVFRPLVGMDKSEIIHEARQIGTYETSILPYEDCCILFAPTNPLTRPDRGDLTGQYESLGLPPLLERAADTAERKEFHRGELVG